MQDYDTQRLETRAGAAPAGAGPPPAPPAGLVDRVRATLVEAALVVPGDRVLVALSGGPDSTALLHVLHAIRDGGDLPFTLLACHLHHGIRGAGAGADERFCAERCRTLAVPLVTDERGVFRLRGVRGPAETRARAARYRFFAHAVAEARATRLAVAHHADDQAETVLFRILRGAGLRGLAGMPARRPLAGAELIRPLLGETRATLRAWLDERAIPYRDDPSNHDPRAARNRLRHVVLPAIRRALRREPRDALVRLATAAAEAHAFLEEEAARRFESVVVERSSRAVVLDRAAIQDLHPALRRPVIARALEGIGADAPESLAWRRIERVLEDTGPRATTVRGGLRAEREGPAIRFARASPETADSARDATPAAEPRTEPVVSGRVLAKIDGPAGVEVPELALSLRCSVEPFPRERGPLGPEPGSGPLVEGFDPDAVTLPIGVRTRRPGDRIELEAGGHQKVQDLLVDRKVPRRRRGRTPLVVDATGRILWVVGVRRSAAARVRDPRAPALVLRAELRRALDQRA